MAQAAIRKQIHALEQYLDTTLLTRSNRRVFLTATGKEFRDAVRTALLELATKTEKLRRKLACVEGVGFALGWRRTTEKMIDNGELIRPLEQSIKVDEALAVYQWQNSPLRARSRSLLQWLRRVCQD
nr:LysR family transcriptional regulator [Pseudomonas piscis]